VDHWTKYTENQEHYEEKWQNCKCSLQTNDNGKKKKLLTYTLQVSD
jgi:hypothetical protein